MAYLPSVPSSGPNEAAHHIQQVFEEEIKSDERNRRYDKFSVSYDKISAQTGYNAPRVTAETAAKLLTTKDRDKVDILDVGAGTGLVGEEMKKLGFTHIDGLEPSDGMLSQLKEKGAYRNCICEAISSQPLAMPKGTYDIITVVGSHGPNHIECGALYEMIRLVKTGGFIIIVTRMEHFLKVTEYKKKTKKNFFPLCEELVKEGKWKEKINASFPNFLSGIEGVRFVYETC